MKFVLLWVTLLALPCLAQPIPSLHASGATITEFVPQGWHIKDTAFGDLNNDKVRDVALVIQCSDSNNIIHLEGLGRHELDTNRRILLLLFFDPTTGTYKLIEYTATFILNDNEPIADDTYEGIEIKGGVLEIPFHLWQNAGSWYAGKHTYKFQYRKDRFFLIGAEAFSMHRASLEFTHESYNFLTGKKKIMTGLEGLDPDVGEPHTEKTTWEKIKIKELKTFTTFLAPFTWHEGNVQL